MRLMLKTERMRAGFTQQALAEAAGIGLSSYFQIEQGFRDGKLETWRRIQRALGAKDEDMWKIMRNVDYASVSSEKEIREINKELERR